MTFERLVRDAGFASQVATTAVGRLGLPRPAEVVTVNCHISADQTARLLADAHIRAVENGSATMLHGLAIPFAISMLQYLAEQSRRSLVLAVEEPEAFLHPAAQEELRSELEQLAERPDVTLLVTTHSPYLVSRKSESSLSELVKDELGQTSVRTTISGAEAHATLTAGLFRDAGMATLIDQTLAIPQTASTVVVTEGHTDAAFLRSAARVCGRHDLVETVHFVSAESAKNVVPQSLVLAGGTALPVIALLDHDEQGRAAADKLVSCSWSKKRQILSLNVLSSQACAMQHDIEIEDLFTSSMWERMIASSGETLWDGQEVCKGDKHYRLNKAGKALALEWIPGNVRPDECTLLIKLLEAIRDRATLMSPQP
jgi:hypothetical protein